MSYAVILKLSGCMLIMLSSMGLGFFKAYTIRKRHAEMLSLKNMLTVLKGEIRYSGLDINEALNNAAKRHNGAMKKFISEVSKKLNSIEGDSLANIWDSSMYVLKEGYLEKQDYEIIEELGKNLGVNDKETQINILENFLERISESIQLMAGNEEQRCKVARSMGIMGGILIVILVL